MIILIKAEQLEARKIKDTVKAGLLTSLLSDISMVGKNSVPPREANDEDAIRVIKKYITSTEDNIKILEKSNNVDALRKNIRELELLNSYLPKQMDKDELANIISSFIELNSIDKSMKNIGVVMKHLNTTYSGTFDSRMASELIKEKLS